MSVREPPRHSVPEPLLDDLYHYAAETTSAVGPRHGQHIAELNLRAAKADLRLKRPYDAIESGSLDPVEAALGERIAGLAALRDQAKADASRIEARQFRTPGTDRRGRP